MILDVTVAVAADYRSARRLSMAFADGTVGYVGTVDGLTGLIADIEAAGVADGVTLISAAPDQELRLLGEDVLRRLQLQGQPRAS